MTQLNALKFEYLKPFRTSGGNIIRMKSLYTMHGLQYVEDEQNKRYPASSVTPITDEEYQAHLDWLEEIALSD